MGQPRRSKKVDNNQNSIVATLRAIDGVSVELDHDDIFVGYKGFNLWFEIKDPASAKDKNGRLRLASLKKSQIDLLRTWPGHYQVIFDVEEILDVLKMIDDLPASTLGLLRRK